MIRSSLSCFPRSMRSLPQVHPLEYQHGTDGKFSHAAARISVSVTIMLDWCPSKRLSTQKLRM